MKPLKVKIQIKNVKMLASQNAYIECVGGKTSDICVDRLSINKINLIT